MYRASNFWHLIKTWVLWSLTLIKPQLKQLSDWIWEWLIESLVTIRRFYESLHWWDIQLQGFMSSWLLIWTSLLAQHLAYEGLTVTCLLHTICPPLKYDSFCNRYGNRFHLCQTTESHCECLTPCRESIGLQHALYCTGSGGWQRRQEEMMSLPGEYLWIPPRLGCLISSILVKVIPYCHLWPT